MGRVVTAALLSALWTPVWLVTATSPLTGSEDAGRQDDGRFSSRVDLVEVYATVTDTAGRPVLGLTAHDFEIRENGRPQSVSVFAAGEFPLTVALGIDRSWSMAGEPLRLAQRASRAFLTALRPSDRSFVLSIGGETDEIAAIETDRSTQARAIGALDPWGTTALYDASIAALARLDEASGRRAFVVFSDGTDRYSRATAEQVIARARRSRALVYPIAIGRTRPPWLAELAAVTGGRSFHLRDARGLEASLAAVADELRHQYLLGYVPADPAAAPGVWRAIRVTVDGRRPGVHVRARDGYETR